MSALHCAAAYARERRFSPDQKIRENKDGKHILTFTAASAPEVVSWVLAHGDEVKVLSAVVPKNWTMC
ncbi:MAG: WYL domain-containing protein [Thermodesulfobacteriota bacterium]